MDFPVDWEIEQLGLSEEFRAAEILEEDGYRTCIVGDVASVVYGSDVVISDLYIAVADNELRSALKTLLERGFLEEPQKETQIHGKYTKGEQLWLARISAPPSATEKGCRRRFAYASYPLEP